MRFHTKSFAAAFLAALTAGCAGLPVDSGRSDIAALTRERGRDPGELQGSATAEMLANVSGKALSASDAVRITLVNSPELRAIYSELGFAAADVYDAGRLSNPTLSASVLFSNQDGAGSQVSFGLAQNFTDLLLLSRRSQFAQAQFERTKKLVATRILELAVDAEAAYFEAAGAAQVASLRDAIANAARASATLAQRFFDAGNITRLQLAQEQAAAAQADIDRTEAQAAVADARTALNTIMGLSGNEQRWLLAPRLSAPLPVEDELADLNRLADSRPDLIAARQNVTALADKLGLVRTFRYMGNLELGIQTERDTDGARLTGPTLGWEIPLFNQGAGRKARAIAELERAEADLGRLESVISNEVRKGFVRVASDKKRIEQYRTALIPSREAVVARTQERANYMLVGQFDLLLAKQQEYQAYEGYLKTVRDYWLSRTALARAIGAQLPSANTASPVLDAEELIRPKDAGMPMNHGDMGDMQMDGMDMKGMDMESKPKGHQGHPMRSGMESQVPEPAQADTPAAEHKYGEHR